MAEEANGDSRVKSKKLMFVGGTDVSKALGFFWNGCHDIFVAASKEDVGRHPGCELRNMDEMQACYAVGCNLRAIKWCDGRPIAARGVHAVSFTYSDGSVTTIKNSKREL